MAVTAVSNVLGTINPIAEIIRRAHDAGAVVLVDGAQSVPHQKIDVQALDCDFLAFSGHKMLGPSGVGVLYGKRELLEAMPPFFGGGEHDQRSDAGRVSAPAICRRSSRPARRRSCRPSAWGRRSIISTRVGLEAIARHERRLTQRAHEVLAAVGGVRILGPAPRAQGRHRQFRVRSGRPHAHDVAQVLDRHGVAIRAGHHCTMPLHKRYGVAATARASFYFYNTLAEVEKLGEALEQFKGFFRPRKRVAR